MPDQLITTRVDNSIFYIQFGDENNEGLQEKTPPVAQQMTNVFNTSAASTSLTMPLPGAASLSPPLKENIQQVSNAAVQVAQSEPGSLHRQQQRDDRARITHKIDDKAENASTTELAATDGEKTAKPAVTPKRRRLPGMEKITFDAPVTTKMSDTEQLVANLQKVTAQLQSGMKPALCLDRSIGRFNDITACAATSVNDRLSANRIMIEGKRVAIATQFPKDDQIEQQLMLYRDHADVILVLTPPDEMKRGKGGAMTDYFSQSGQFGNMATESKPKGDGNELVLAGGMKFKLYDLKLQGSEQVKTVIHAQNWPDYAAASKEGTLELIGQLPQFGDRLVVHCTAGVGRTGQIIAAHIMQDPAFQHMSLEEIITRMREQRNSYMVQSEAQLNVLIDIAREQGRPLLAPLS